MRCVRIITWFVFRRRAICRPSVRVAEEGETQKGVSAVYRQSDGAPLQSAVTTVRGIDMLFSASSRERDDRGMAVIDGIPPGTYNVEVRAPGYSVARHPGTVIRAGETVQF